MKGTRKMTVYKPIKKLVYFVEKFAFDLANGKPVKTTDSIFNGNTDVKSVLFDPMVIDKINIKILIMEGYISDKLFNGVNPVE